ncbi:2OG-Fe(II) oxygenase [Nocardia sp. NPDC001965]
MFVALDSSWRGRIETWIGENLEQGNSAESIVEYMTDFGFDRETVTTAVRVVLHGRTVDTSLYEYDPSPIPPDREIRVHDRTIQTLIRLEKPQLTLFDNVLSAAECDRIVEMSKDRLQPSTIIDPATGLFEQTATRSSESVMFELSENPLIDSVDKRISALMNCPLENGEGLQVVHYRTGGQYLPHFDYFAPDGPGSVGHLSNGGQRIATLVVYLNDVEAGGGTSFPEAGITLYPRKGQAIYFRYSNELGQLDPSTIHAGMPVLAGEKWIINKWVRRYRISR